MLMPAPRAERRRREERGSARPAAGGGGLEAVEEVAGDKMNLYVKGNNYQITN
jgi:hypothetical protein